MDEGLLSVIVPVYGTEAYLDRCVESLTAQTYRRLEIVLVDDGSPDRCGALCDAWAARDERVRALHQENQGASAARNYGMAESRGTLLTFVDSDDWIEPDTYETVLAAMTEDTDAVFFGWFDHWGGRSAPARINCPLRWGDGGDARLWMLRTRSGYRGYMCNKVYRRRALETAAGLIPVPEGFQSTEDLVWNQRAAANFQKVLFLDKPLYQYDHRFSSASWIPQRPERAAAACQAREGMLALLAGEREDVRRAALYGYHWFLCNAARNCYLRGFRDEALAYLGRMRRDGREAYESAAPPVERLENRLLCAFIRRDLPRRLYAPLFRGLNALDCALCSRSAVPY